MRKSFILFAFLLGCIGLQAQNYHITLHRSGSVIHNNDVNDISEIVFQGHSPATMVINTESGTYSFPITRFDSITFHTEQNDIPHGYDFLKICENELPYTWHGVTFYEGGIQNITLQTPQGNDSIVSLNLSVYPTYETEEYMTVCPSALPVVWNGVTFYEAGTESVSMQTIYGCDSIMTLHLSVSETITVEEYMHICENELPFIWHGMTFTASGTQSVTFQSSQGCDSIVTLHLTAYPTQTGDDYMTIYDNQLPYIWQGITFNGEGSQTVTLQTEFGCDSIVTLHLTVVPAPTGDTVYITYNGTPTGTALILGPNQYWFCSKPAAQAVAFTIPKDWTETSYDLTEGVIQVTGFGDPIGNHRLVNKVGGRSPNFTAISHQTYFGALPDAIIPVKQLSKTLATLVLNPSDATISSVTNSLGDEVTPEEGKYLLTEGENLIIAENSAIRITGA